MAIAVIFTAVGCPAVFSADGETDALPENVLIRVGGKSVTDDIGGDPIGAGHRYNLLNPDYDRWGLGTYRDSYYDNQSCHKFRRGENYTKDVDFVCWPSNGVTISETATALNFYWTIRFLLRAEG